MQNLGYGGLTINYMWINPTVQGSTVAYSQTLLSFWLIWQDWAGRQEAVLLLNYHPEPDLILPCDRYKDILPAGEADTPKLSDGDSF